MKPRILIVEDESILAMNFESILSSFNYNVVGIASDGEDAIKKASELKPDLILMDIILNGDIDGIEAAAQIKDNFGVPIVYLTAHPEESAIKRAKLTSPHGYLIKPVNKTDLKNTVELALYKYEMEEALKESESLYKMLFENSQVSTAITSIDGHVINANEKFLDMVGYKENEKNEIDLRSMYYDTNQRDHIIETLKQGGKIREYEVKLRRKDGTRYINSINVDMIRYQGEDAMLVTAIDITKREKAEKYLLDINRRYNDLVNNMSSGLAVYRAVERGNNFIFIDINQAAEDIDSVKKEDVIGKKVTDVFPGVEDFGLLEVFQRVYKTGTPEHHPISKYTDNRITGWRNNLVYKLPTGEIVTIYEDITKQKTAEEELKESEKRFRSVQENSLDRFTILKPFYNKKDELIDFTFVYQNTNAAKTAGHRPEELIGHRMTEIWPTFLQTRFFEMYNQAVETEQVVEFEEKYHADGVDDWFHVTVTPITDGIAINTQIITDRKKAENALAKSEQRYREIVETANEGISVHEYDGTISYVNKRMADMLGYSKDEIIGRSTSDFVNYEEIENKNQIQEELSDVNNLNFERKMIRKDGSILYTLSKSSKRYDSNGNFIGYLAMHTDITERKIAENNLMESNERFKLMANGTPGLIFVDDEEGNHLFVNDHYLEYFNITEEEVSGLKWQPLIHKDDLPEYLKKVKIALSTHEPFFGQARVLRGDGEWRWIETSAMPRFSANNEYIGHVGISIDIHERKKAERDIRKSLNEKENLLKEIHHRVKNNLQIISSLLNLQEDYVNEDPIAVNVLKESQNRVVSMAMIHEMIYQSEDLSRINFSDYIRNLTTNLFHSYGIKNITSVINVYQIYLNIETAIPLGLIISELVSNSLKYAFPNDKSREISINLKNEGKEHNLIISDNGIGISEEIDFTTESSLGLRLVYSLVNQLDGKIKLDRSNGTKYTIIFKELKYTKRF